MSVHFQNNNDKTNKRTLEDQPDQQDEPNPVTSVAEPYFRTILKLERQTTNEERHLNTLKRNIAADTIPKSLQIRLRPAKHVVLNTEKLLKWETLLLETSKKLQDLLTEHWEEKIEDTKKQNREIRGALRDGRPTKKGKRRGDASNEDQQ